jgi:hypothetical protein
MIQLLFYTTSHCHLCEEAQFIIKNAHLEIILIAVEITDDNLLIEKYGMKIPVLKRSDNKTELNWPFDEAKLKTFLS